MQPLRRRLFSLFQSVGLVPLACIILVFFSGLFYMYKIPPQQIPDEPGHFARAYELSKLHPVAVQTSAEGRYGFLLPEPIHHFSDAYLNLLFKNEKDARVYSVPFQHLKLSAAEHSSAPAQTFNLENVAIYSPVTYVPQALGLAIARALDMTVLQAFYMGRLFGLLSFIAVLVLAFRWLPRRAHLALFVVATLPTVVQQAASYSADGMTTSFAILFVAFIAYALTNYRRAGFRRGRAFVVLTLLVVLLALCKQVYCLLGLLALPVAWKLIKNKKLAFAGGAGVFAAGLIATSIWNIFVSDVGLNYAVLAGSTTVEPARQLHHMLLHPLTFLRAIFDTSFLDSYDTDRLMTSGLIGKIGAQGAFLPEWGVVLAYLSMCLAVLRHDDDHQEGPVSTAYLWLIAGTAACVVLGVMAALYVSFTDYHSLIINSLSGRYFAPLAAVLLLAALWKNMPRISISRLRASYVVIGIAVLNFGVIALGILQRFIL